MSHIGLLSFMSTKVHLNQIFSALVYHKARGVGRLLGLQYFLQLTSTLQSQTLVSELLLHLSLALRQPNREIPVVKVSHSMGQLCAYKHTVLCTTARADVHWMCG